MSKWCDKRLLAALFVFMVLVVIYLHWLAPEPGTTQWARETANLIIGGLVGLVTGALLAGGGNPPNGESQ
jgi:uncharacterized membrane protein YfcA